MHDCSDLLAQCATFQRFGVCICSCGSNSVVVVVVAIVVCSIGCAIVNSFLTVMQFYIACVVMDVQLLYVFISTDLPLAHCFSV
jgi:hypothetical protein